MLFLKIIIEKSNNRDEKEYYYKNLNILKEVLKILGIPDFSVNRGIKNFDQAKKYFKTILFEHKGSLYAAESRKRFRKLAGNTNEKIEKDSG